MPEPTNRFSADEALARLREGHRRFLQRLRGDAAPASLSLPRAHRPVAAVVGCADARVAPETLFDAPLGELFVVRSAGQMAGAAGVASLEFAVGSLGVPLVVVLGHTQCGALKAAVEGGAGLPEQLARLVRELRAGLPPDVGDADAAAPLQVRRVLSDLLAASPLLAQEAAAGRLRLEGAVYDVTNGDLRWL
ncbi:carbonic anhydrase [Oceanithermus profundus]